MSSKSAMIAIHYSIIDMSIVMSIVITLLSGLKIVAMQRHILKKRQRIICEGESTTHSLRRAHLASLLLTSNASIITLEPSNFIGFRRLGFIGISLDEPSPVTCRKTEQVVQTHSPYESWPQR